MSAKVREDLVLSHAVVTAEVEALMEQLDGDQCRYTNTVTSHPTEDFLEFIIKNGQTFTEAAEARQEASGRH